MSRQTGAHCPGGWGPRPSSLLRIAVAMSAHAARTCSGLGRAAAGQRRPCQQWRVQAAPAGGSSSSDADASEAWLRATGVPVLREMQKCGSLQDCARVGALALARVGATTLLLSAVLHLVERKILASSAASRPKHASTEAGTAGASSSRPSSSSSSSQPSSSSSSSQPSSSSGTSSSNTSSGPEGGAVSEELAERARRALLSSLVHQAQRLLPWWAATSSATVACALLQVSLSRLPGVLTGVLGGAGASAALSKLRGLTQFLQDAAEEVLVALWAFTLMDAKGSVVKYTQRWLQDAGEHTARDAAGLVAAGSLAADTVIISSALMFTLANYGVNLQPLLASLGASSIVAGLAAQSLLRNLAAGVTLYASRPFSVGDQVVFYSIDSGSVACQGTVLALHPMRTEVAGRESRRGAKDGGIFYLNNGDIVEKMIVHNTSRTPAPDRGNRQAGTTLAAAAAGLGLTRVMGG